MKKKNAGTMKGAKRALYIVSSLVVAGTMFIAMPVFIEFGSNFIHKKMQKPIMPQNNDDWGPQIVKRTEQKEESNNGRIQH